MSTYSMSQTDYAAELEKRADEVEEISPQGLSAIDHIRNGPGFIDYYSGSHPVWAELDFLQFRSPSLQSPLPPDATYIIGRFISNIRHECVRYSAEINPVTRIIGIYTLASLYTLMYDFFGSGRMRRGWTESLDREDIALLRRILRNPTLTPRFVMHWIISRMSAGELELASRDVYHVPLRDTLDTMCERLEGCGENNEPPTLTADMLREVLRPIMMGPPWRPTISWH